MILDNVKDFVKNNKWAQHALVLLVGVAIGAIFYPSKHIEDRVTQKYEAKITQLNEEHTNQIKTLNEQFNLKEEEYKSIMYTKSEELNKLTVKFSQLKSSKKTTYYKIVHPDGTVEVKASSDTEKDETSSTVTKIKQEYTEKVASIEKKWETIHKQRVEQIKTEFDKKEQTYKTEINQLEKSRVEDINPKKYGIEGGATLDTSYYMHVNADVFGPFFIGAHAEVGRVNTLGAGVGIRF